MGMSKLASRLAMMATTDETDGCLSTCEVASCGDGYVQTGIEACDDGNDVETDGCLSTCEVASCGDGYVQTGIEACDDGNTMSKPMAV